MTQSIAICPGSFDPPTLGHINIIKRSLTLFDQVIVAVAINRTKAPLFSVEERTDLLSKIFMEESRIQIDSFEGLLVQYAQNQNAQAILRGIRNMSDYEYESQMALANKTMAPEIETVVMMTECHFAHLSSTIIKDVIEHKNEESKMIHPLVKKALKKKLQED